MSTLEHPTKLAERARYWRLHGRTATAEALEAELAAASVERSLGPDCAARITRDES